MSEKKLKVIKITRTIGIIFMVIAILSFLLVYLLQPKAYGCIGKATFLAPAFIASDYAERYAIIDSNDIVYVIDKDYNIEFLIESDGIDKYTEAAFDSEGNLYLLLSSDTEEGIDETLKIYDIEGKFLRDIYYSDNMSDESIMGIQIVDDELCYIEQTAEYDAYVLSDLNGKEINRTEIVSNDDWTYVSEARPDGNGNYALVFNMYSTGIFYADGEYEEYECSDFDFYDNKHGYLFSSAVPYEGGLAVIADTYNDGLISYLKNPYDSMEDLVDIKDICDTSIDKEYKDNIFISNLNIVDDKLAISAFEHIYIYDDGDVEMIDACNKLPIAISINNIIDKYAIYLGAVSLVIALILLIGSIAKWRLSLLGKQLIVTVPVIVIMFAVLTISFIKAYDKMYFDNTANSLLQLNESIVEFLDGDKLESMSSLEALKTGEINKFDTMLNDSLVAGSNDWSENVECTIYLLDGELTGLNIVDSEFYLTPFISRLNWGNSINDYYEKTATADSLKVRGDSLVIYSGAYYSDNISAGTYIYNSYGEPVALFVTMLNYYAFLNEREALIREIVIKVIAFLIILIALIVLLTYINTRRLKLAGNAITEIAAGNFSARVKNMGKDEVAAICGGVNDMAEKLELHFEELDRNEKFYYKFVPEKFKELLHKDSFTDLQLGDAESVDLTVLFCDIRSFSLNSEMMTAKENFEFVNVIYGKAGPIIREHNGFVDKYIGDAVMALFENADDAIAAGKELYHEIVLNKSTAQELGVQSINIGIGIHSGMARIGIVGEDERLSGTVISNTVNISSRLESLTKQYNTAMIITKETLDRLSDPDSLSVRYLGMIQVAGVNEVKALYEVLACLDDERRETREKTSFEFREAIKAYHLGKAKDSAKLLEPLVLAAKNDPVPKMYFDYVNEKIAINDNEHNVFKFEKK